MELGCNSQKTTWIDVRAWIQTLCKKHEGNQFAWEWSDDLDMKKKKKKIQ